jgi:ribosome maturation factor RimP
MANNEKIEQALAPLFSQEKMELVDLKIGNHGHKTLLQFFIDRLDASAVTIDDCETMSDKISSMLDMENLVGAAYVIEVSSPGVDRVLKTPAHFKRFVNERVKIILREPREGLGFFTGIIASADDARITLSDGMKKYDFKYEEIKSARLDPVLEF